MRLRLAYSGLFWLIGVLLGSYWGLIGVLLGSYWGLIGVLSVSPLAVQSPAHDMCSMMDSLTQEL